ncbi:3733_t:CDS:1, partial [Cetraspora pellucida]
YRDLIATLKDLPKNWLVSKEKYNIDEIMQVHILLLEFDIKLQMPNSNSDNEKSITTLGKSGYYSISRIF